MGCCVHCILWMKGFWRSSKTKLQLWIIYVQCCPQLPNPDRLFTFCHPDIFHKLHKICLLFFFFICSPVQTERKKKQFIYMPLECSWMPWVEYMYAWCRQHTTLLTALRNSQPCVLLLQTNVILMTLPIYRYVWCVRNSNEHKIIIMHCDLHRQNANSIYKFTKNWQRP